MRLHVGQEGRELRVAVNAGFDGRFFDGKIHVARTRWPEQVRFEIGAYGPIGRQRLDIARRNATVEMGFDVP